MIPMNPTTSYLIPKGVKTKPSRRSLEMFRYFSACDDAKRLLEPLSAPDGFTAAECFHVRETYGIEIPCREPEKLCRALNGKEQHGLNVTHCAEDYVGRILFSSDLKQYPEWVRGDILGRARQIAMKVIGYIPKFVLSGQDFSTT